MSKRRYWVLLVLVSILSCPAMAEEHAPAAGDALQREAEEILKSEPDARNVTVREEVKPVNPVGASAVNLEEMDINKDGVLARDEVGEKLFRIFDGDGNEVIDNIEMKKPRLMVFTPMERNKVDIIDYQDGTQSVRESVSHEEFLQESKLANFDKSKDGLSPLDFVEKSFMEVNVHKDGVIDLYEWKRAYADSVRPMHMESFNYN